MGIDVAARFSPDIAPRRVDRRSIHFGVPELIGGSERRAKGAHHRAATTRGSKRWPQRPKYPRQTRSSRNPLPRPHRSNNPPRRPPQTFLSSCPIHPTKIDHRSRRMRRRRRATITTAMRLRFKFDRRSQVGARHPLVGNTKFRRPILAAPGSHRATPVRGGGWIGCENGRETVGRLECRCNWAGPCWRL